MAQRRKNGSGTLRQRKDGRWDGRVVVSYDDDGKPKTKNVLATTKAECNKKLKELIENTQCVTGKVPTQAKPDMPFGEWLDLDLRYIREQCFLSDWKILLGTVVAVLRMDGV